MRKIKQLLTASSELQVLVVDPKTRKEYVINKTDLVPTPADPTAANVTYDNTDSGLTATDTQAAIDELLAVMPAHSAPFPQIYGSFTNNGVISFDMPYNFSGVSLTNITTLSGGIYRLNFSGPLAANIAKIHVQGTCGRNGTNIQVAVQTTSTIILYFQDLDTGAFRAYDTDVPSYVHITVLP